MACFNFIFFSSCLTLFKTYTLQYQTITLEFKMPFYSILWNCSVSLLCDANFNDVACLITVISGRQTISNMMMYVGCTEVLILIVQLFSTALIVFTVSVDKCLEPTLNIFILAELTWLQTMESNLVHGDLFKFSLNKLPKNIGV